MNKFLFFVLSFFCCQSIIIGGPVFSLVKDISSILHTIMVDPIDNIDENDLWVQSILANDLYAVNKLACDYPYLVDKINDFSNLFENENKTTALSYAIKNGNEAIVVILLAHQASAKIKDDRGLNAQELANTSDSKPIKRLISSPKTQRKYYQRKSL